MAMSTCNTPITCYVTVFRNTMATMAVASVMLDNYNDVSLTWSSTPSSVYSSPYPPT